MESQIRAELARIETQRRAIIEDAKLEGLRPEQIYNLRDRNGNYIMIPLLQAQANLLLAMTNLKAVKR